MSPFINQLSMVSALHLQVQQHQLKTSKPHKSITIQMPPFCQDHAQAILLHRVAKNKTHTITRILSNAGGTHQALRKKILKKCGAALATQRFTSLENIMVKHIACKLTPNKLQRLIL